jgi:hypothetical protein
MTRQHEDELDARLLELFRAVEQPELSPGFASRTLKAVHDAPLPDGRQRLRSLWSVRLGWGAFTGAAAATAYVFVNLPLAARVFASMIGFTLDAAAALVRFVFAGLAWSELFMTIGRAVATAAATREGTTTLIVTAVVAGIALSALRRLLSSEGEASQWHELSSQ